jgi:phosphodiesterase/alkaline phosphatase D-like protein
MQRPAFLQSTVVGGLGLLGGTSAEPLAGPPARDPFTLGVASGDPTSDAVVLWTRLAPDPLHGSGMPGTSISSSFPEAFIEPVRAALADNPHTRFFDGRYRGYVRCTVTPDVWSADFRAVPTILDEQAEAFTLASFVVLSGQPGALSAAS